MFSRPVVLRVNRGMTEIRVARLGQALSEKVLRRGGEGSLGPAPRPSMGSDV